MSSSEDEEFQGEESSEEEFQADEESEEEEEFLADEESDDEPIAAASKTKKKRAIPDDDDDDDDSDSDDDIPLAALKSPPKKKKAAPEKKAPPKKKATKAKASKPKPKNKKDSASSIASNGSFRTASAALFGTNCQKGQLIQTLLCRWWYAIDWPQNIPDDPPKHYDSLDGMPGVFVCTSGGDVGKIKDMRDMTTCPNFKNFSKMDSSKLKDLVIKALKAQKEALIEADGAGTDTEKELNSKIKWAEKLNPDKADKEAVKVLKGAKVSLSS